MGRGDVGFEEVSEVSGGDEGSGYSFGMWNGKGGGVFEEERKGSCVLFMDEDVKFVGYFGE